MLELNHPQTQHIFRAGGLLDRIKDASQAMTLASAPVRLILLDESRRYVEALHRLNDEHFEASAFIYGALLELQAALEELAGGKSSGIGPSDGEACPRCGAALRYIDIKCFKRSLCDPCLEPIEKAEYKLDSLQGFATICI